MTKIYCTGENILAQINCFGCFANATSCNVKHPIKYIRMSIVESYPKKMRCKEIKSQLIRGLRIYKNMNRLGKYYG